MCKLLLFFFFSFSLVYCVADFLLLFFFCCFCCWFCKCEITEENGVIFLIFCGFKKLILNWKKNSKKDGVENHNMEKKLYIYHFLLVDFVLKHWKIFIYLFAQNFWKYYLMKIFLLLCLVFLLCCCCNTVVVMMVVVVERKKNIQVSFFQPLFFLYAVIIFDFFFLWCFEFLILAWIYSKK